MSDWVRLAAYPNTSIAELLRSALEANGIESRVFNALASSIMPHLSQMITADVMVREKDLEAAKTLLREFENFSDNDVQ